MELHGRKIIVTGAASGIGKELIRQLLAYEVRIVAADLNPKGCPSVPDRVFPLRCDVSSPADLDLLFEFAGERLGGVDLCFSNAGFAYYETLGPPDWARIAQIFQTNVFAALYASQKMSEQNGEAPFKVVITASAMAFLPLPGYALYSATKAALSAFAEAHRFELGDKSQITLVYPIATRTEFFGQGAYQAPVPWPIQEPSDVARAILRGVQRDKTQIFPYPMSRVLLVLNQLFPWLGRIYQRIQWRKFQEWEESLAEDPAAQPGQEESFPSTEAGASPPARVRRPRGPRRLNPRPTKQAPTKRSALGH